MSACVNSVFVNMCRQSISQLSTRILQNTSKQYTHMNLPKIKQPAEPANPAIVAMAVAVVRCSGGNHSAETDGPAVKTTGPAEPMINCATCANLDNDQRTIRYDTRCYFNVYTVVLLGK